MKSEIYIKDGINPLIRRGKMKGEIYHKDDPNPFKIIDNIKLVSCGKSMTIIHTHSGEKYYIDNDIYYTMIVD